jgi:hypothetical protein
MLYAASSLSSMLPRLLPQATRAFSATRSTISDATTIASVPQELLKPLSAPPLLSRNDIHALLNTAVSAFLTPGSKCMAFSPFVRHYSTTKYFKLIPLQEAPPINIVPKDILRKYDFEKINHPPLAAHHVVPFTPGEEAQSFTEMDRAYRRLAVNPTTVEEAIAAYNEPTKFTSNSNIFNTSRRSPELLFSSVFAQTDSGFINQRYMLHPFSFKWARLNPNLDNISLEQSRLVRIVGSVYFASVAGVRDSVLKAHAYFLTTGAITSRRFLMGADLEQCRRFTRAEDVLKDYNPETLDKKTFDSIVQELIHEHIVMHVMTACLDQNNPKNLLIVDPRSQVTTGTRAYKRAYHDLEMNFPNKILWKWFNHYEDVPVEAGYTGDFYWRQQEVKKNPNLANDLLDSTNPTLQLLMMLHKGDKGALCNTVVDPKTIDIILKTGEDQDKILEVFQIYPKEDLAKGKLPHQTFRNALKEAAGKGPITCGDILRGFAKN